MSADRTSQATSIKIYWHRQNECHTEVRIFIGPDDEHRGYAGTLMMRHTEADAFLQRIMQGIPPEMVQQK